LKPNQAGDKTRANMMGWGKGFRGGKHEMYEGGVRIPFIVRWPGKIPPGRVNHSSILSGLDFLPTLCHLSGTSYDKNKFEGLNVSDVWLGEKRNYQRFLFWAKQSPVGLSNNWKYHVNKQTGDELYDLAKDPNETNNLITKNPEKAASMRSSVMTWYGGLPVLATKARGSNPKK
jgi:N-acetylgalactosamine-6-sulfatase